jgi:hypothetical protein
MPEKATMTLNLTRVEMDVLDAIAEDKGMSKTAVLRQALRLYQVFDTRLKEGESFSFSGDKKRIREFSGLILP